jgi:membrane associated rhomboid family serine protease
VASLAPLHAGLAEQAEFLRRWAFVPAQIGAGQGFGGLLTGMFLHGGWLHLLANLYFLWLFGDNVEDRLNRALFLGFYLACGLAAFGLHGLAHPGSHIPVLGASGAISGIMGAYLVLYPHRQMYQVFWFIQFRISVVFYLVVWLGIQILFSAIGSAGVAWFAHIGGFAFGALLMWWFRQSGWVRSDPFAPRNPTRA